MASVSFHVPVAIILLGGGLVACFFGYRLLRTLLALYGFIGGVVVAALFTDGFEPWLAVATTITGGLLGAVLAVVAYLAGVALFGAALGALLVDVFYPEVEPRVWLVVAACLAGALLALAVRRYVLILATSFGGAWTALVGGLALAGNGAAMAAASGDLQELPPLAAPDTQMGFVVGWCALGGVAMIVQLRWFRRRRYVREG